MNRRTAAHMTLGVDEEGNAGADADCPKRAECRQSSKA